jgi:hypothetical protein
MAIFLTLQKMGFTKQIFLPIFEEGRKAPIFHQDYVPCQGFPYSLGFH